MCKPVHASILACGFCIIPGSGRELQGPRVARPGPPGTGGRSSPNLNPIAHSVAAAEATQETVESLMQKFKESFRANTPIEIGQLQPAPRSASAGKRKRRSKSRGRFSSTCCRASTDCPPCLKILGRAVPTSLASLCSWCLCLPDGLSQRCAWRQQACAPGCRLGFLSMLPPLRMRTLSASFRAVQKVSDSPWKVLSPGSKQSRFCFN